MKIPVEKCKKLLHKFMYKDTATIYRSVKIKNPITGAMEFSHQAVYKNLPCKLSQYKDLNTEQDDRVQGVDWDFRLNCDPEIVIEEGDVVDVIHGRETFKLFAGTSFNYDTHKEISMIRRKEAKQR